jgi:CSLREA domain-containing protein
MRTINFSSLFSKFLTAMALVAMVLAALPVMPVHAAEIIVNTTVDELATNGSCSLREAIINANNDGPPPQPYPDCAMGTGADTIILQSGTTYTLSLVDSTHLGGDLDIVDVDGLTIQANGDTPAIIDANGIDRVIETTPGTGPLTLVGITITNGNAAGGGRGGGILYASNAALTLVNSTISNNVATNNAACGAGIYNGSSATVTISNSTFDGNSCTGASGDGGGLWKGTGGALNISGSTFSGNSVNGEGKGGGMRLLAGTATITNSTFANNTAGNDGGAIQVNGATISIDFSTFSGNAANDPNDPGGGAIQVESGSAAITASILANSTDFSDGKDCNQTLTGTATLTNTLVENNDNCGTNSVITGDPALGALANNGGPTQTMAITNTSLAYNAASSCGSTISDQRGIARPQAGLCDLGAYELGDSNAAPVVLSVVRADSSPTLAASVDFTVIFSEAVTGVDATDFSLSATVVGATVTSVLPASGPAAVYTVTVDTGTGDGTIRLDVNGSGTGIEDLGGNPLAGGFTGGEEYTIIEPASINVYIADELEASYLVPPGESLQASYAVNNGPVQITSTNGLPLIAAMRVIWQEPGERTSYSELMGLPKEQLSDEYWFPWYNNLAKTAMNQQFRFGNADSTSTTIEVYVGDTLLESYPNIAPGVSLQANYEINNGPIRIVSTDGKKIIAAMRVIWQEPGERTSYSELMGLPAEQLSTEYWFPWYNNLATTAMNQQFRFGVP